MAHPTGFFRSRAGWKTHSTVQEESAEFPQINPIEPGSGPRKTSLKTRIVKKELGPTSKRKVSTFDSLRRGIDSLESIQIEIHRHDSTRDDHSFKSSGSALRGFFAGDCGAEFPELLLKSKSSGSVK